MALFTIEIRGIALSYFKDDMWKVLFPFDDCHKVRFYWITSGADGLPELGPTISLKKKKRWITINAENSQAQPSDEVDEIVDMTCSYSHPRIEKRSKWAKRAVGLSLADPNVRYRAHQDTGGDYSITAPGQTPEQLGTIPYSTRFTISASRLIMTLVPTMTGTPLPFDQDTTLVFDNDCDEVSDESDLKLLYKVVKETGDEGRKCKIERIGGLILPEYSRSPERYGGLPCHGLKASNPNGLP